MVSIVITKQGLEKIAGATVEEPLVLEKFAVGDGGGQEIEPNEDMTSLVNEKHRDYINDKYSNGNNITCECVISSDAKISEGFYVREIGLFDIDGVMIAIAKTPLQFRPGSDGGNIVTELMFSIVLQVSNSAAITIEIPQTIFASVDSVNREIKNRELADNNLNNLILKKESESVSRDNDLGIRVSKLENTNLQIFAEQTIEKDTTLINLTQVGDKTVTQYVDGLEVTFRTSNNSGNNMNVQVNGLGYKNIKYLGVGSYLAGDIKTLIYNKSKDNFEITDKNNNSIKPLTYNERGVVDFNELIFSSCVYIQTNEPWINKPNIEGGGFLEVLVSEEGSILQYFKTISSLKVFVRARRVISNNFEWLPWKNIS